MERSVDLHLHTTASDGTMFPAELVKYAVEKGLSGIAITDHDTVDGIAEALEEASNHDIEVIPGIEISVEHKVEIHILGYFTKNNYTNIIKVLRVMQEAREERNKKIIKKLNEFGFDIHYEEVKNEAKGNIIGRPHIARVLKNKGYVSSMKDAFNKYLGRNGKAYFLRESKLSPEKAIQEILKSGGVPVIAHPILLGFGRKELEKLIVEFKQFGLKGIEVFYTENTTEQTSMLKIIAEKYELIKTGGSDFHGDNKDGIEIGKGKGHLKIPYSSIEQLKKLLE